MTAIAFDILRTLGTWDRGSSLPLELAAARQSRFLRNTRHS